MTTVGEEPHLPEAARTEAVVAERGDDGWEERIFRAGRGGRLVGIHTRPADPTSEPDSSSPVALFLNAGVVHHAGPHRSYVTMARRLAAAGVSSVRFDLSGIGDSALPPREMAYEETLLLDTRAVMDEMGRLQGQEDFLLFGICAGAVGGFDVACHDERVRGAFLVDGYAYRTPMYYLYRYGRRLLRAESWMNVLRGRNPLGRRLRRTLGIDVPDSIDRREEMLRPWAFRFPPREEFADRLRELIGRDVSLCFLYTGSWDHYYNHAGQFRRAFRDVDFRDRIRVEYLPGADHTFTLVRDQRRLARLAADWAVQD